MTPHVLPAEGCLKEAPANTTQAPDPKPASHFRACHCSCTAGQRIVAVLLTGFAILQVLGLAFSLHQAAPRGYETVSDVNTSLGSSR